MARTGRPLTFYVGSAILFIAVLVALLAPRLAPFDPRLPSGAPLAVPNSAHWLGTNDLGQDQLSQLLYGARTSLFIAAIVVAISTTLSWLVGLIIGFFRRSEPVLLTIVDLLLALPSIPLYLLIISLIGSSRLTLALMLGFLSWPAFARIVRAVVMQTRSAEYIAAARASGASELWIVRRHVLPATLDILPTKLALTLRFAIFAEATLAFLGLGATGAISWGTMLSWAFSDPLLFSRDVWPWLVLPPAFAIVLLILSTVWVTGGFRPRWALGGRVEAPVVQSPERLRASSESTGAALGQDRNEQPATVMNQ